MNRIRYWKRQYYLVCSLFDNHGKKLGDIFLKRLFNLACEIGDYLENLELKEEAIE